MAHRFIITLDEEEDRFDVWTEAQPKLHVGYLNYWLKDQYLEIADVLLEPDYRQKGIGSDLMRLVIKLAKNKKCKSVRLGTQADDFPVHRFYKKHGFKLSGIKDGEVLFILVLE
jgi:ribosomal protein S18 acetylase RimI-like enzyme